MLIDRFNVYLTVVEKMLTDHPDVQEAGMTRIPHRDKDGKEVLLACVVLPPGNSVSEEDLIDFQRLKLATYKVARRMVFLAELPKTGLGKTLRRELAQAARHS